MLYVKMNTHVTDHHRFVEAGPHARDLWTWGMLYAGKHETDGELPMSAVLTAPWGYGGRSNIKAATRLVEVGLWARTDAGYRICRWSEQGNMTRASIESDREAARERMRKRRTPSPDNQECSPEQTANKQRTSPDVPTSTFNSSGLKISEADQKILPGGSTADPLAPAPEWFAGVVASLSMSQVVDLRLAECWAAYCGHATDKGKAPNEKHAAYWLTTVMVPKRRDEAKADARQRERDKRYADHTPKYEQPTAGQTSAFQQELAKRLREEAKKGAA